MDTYSLLIKSAASNADMDGTTTWLILNHIEESEFDCLKYELAMLSNAQLPKSIRQKRHRFAFDSEMDDPLKSSWYRSFLDTSRMHHGFQENSGHRAKQFRNLFRVPWVVFTHLLNMLHPFFPETTDCCGRPSAPLGLLLMGSLCILGETLSFQALKHTTNLGQQTHRNFFKKFLKWGRSHLYPLHVRVPQTEPEFTECMQDYAKLGFPGTLCSVDATHVEMHACADNMKMTASGKNGKPTRAFQICVNFRRRIISTTTSVFGSWNDKTIAKKDQFLRSLRENKIGSQIKWTTFNADGQETERIGFLHAICDGGYPPYGNLLCAKIGTTDSDVREWNSRIGQIRKDVECCFGSIKRRFRIFKNGWKLRSIELLDDAWLTCCALHNLLLDFDEESPDVADSAILSEGQSYANNSQGSNDGVCGFGEDNQDDLPLVVRDSLEVRRNSMVAHFTEVRARNEIIWVAARTRPSFSFDADDA